MASREITDCSTSILLPLSLVPGQVVGTGLELENCSLVHTSSQGHPACHPSRLTIKENVISCHFMDKKRGAGSEAVGGQASWSLRGNQSPRNRPPTDPSHPGVGSHRQQWTWGCFRSWGWERVEGSAAVSVSDVLPPSPVATARPSCPSRWLHGCWTLAAAAVVGSWRKAGAGPG